MAAKDEIKRLDQMGADAATAARHQNHWMNHAGHRDHTSRHFALGQAALPNMPIVGRLAIPVFLTFVICVFLGWGFGVQRPVPFALAAILILEASWYLFKRRRLSRLRDQATGLNAQLHDLKEQEFTLRYEEAKRSGDLDRFNTQEKT